MIKKGNKITDLYYLWSPFGLFSSIFHSNSKISFHRTLKPILSYLCLFGLIVDLLFVQLHFHDP